MSSIRRFWQLIVALAATVRDLLREMLSRRKKKSPRPWSLFVITRQAPGEATSAQCAALLRQMGALGDNARLARFAGQFNLPESDYFADPKQIERLIDRFVVENPPWLHLNRVLAGGEQGDENHSQEFLYREQEVREHQDAEIFVPDTSWKDRPLASLTVRPARTLNEVWRASLLEQVLPPEVMVDRWSRGEIIVPVRDPIKQRLEFRSEFRRIEVVTRRMVPVPIDVAGGSGKGGQLLYFLLDFSSSMKGSSAVLAMAVIVATIRSHIGQANTRYLFRRYAQHEQLWPHRVDSPLQAHTVQEKDALVERILATNFNGSATDVNDAIAVAVADVEKLRAGENLEAEILLVTDGRAEMLESTRLALLRAQVKVHTVMVVPEPNPGLEALSESFTFLDVSSE